MNELAPGLSRFMNTHYTRIQVPFPFVLLYREYIVLYHSAEDVTLWRCCSAAGSTWITWYHVQCPSTSASFPVSINTSLPLQQRDHHFLPRHLLFSLVQIESPQAQSSRIQSVCLTHRRSSTVNWCSRCLSIRFPPTTNPTLCATSPCLFVFLPASPSILANGVSTMAAHRPPILYLSLTSARWNRISRTLCTFHSMC